MYYNYCKMGKCESVCASLGVKVLVADLLEQLDESNFEIIKKMLYHGCIEDSNDYYNEVYKEIVGYGEGDTELPEDDYLEYKKCLLKACQEKGSLYKSKTSSRVVADLNHGCLLEKELLVPIKDILSTERWGYGRSGINSKSRPLDFDLSFVLGEYACIQKVSLVFFVKQQS